MRGSSSSPSAGAGDVPSLHDQVLPPIGMAAWCGRHSVTPKCRRNSEHPNESTCPSPIGSASILKDGRAVFNIAGNKYRLVVWINYPYRVVYVRFIGTHAEYDTVDVRRI